MCEQKPKENIILLMGKQPVKAAKNVHRRITRAFAQKEGSSTKQSRKGR